MKLDDAGRHAASLLEHEVRERLDTARSLQKLHDAAERPARLRPRPKPLLVAFASVLVVVTIAALIGETRRSNAPSSNAPSSTVPENIYSYLPDMLPPGMHALEGTLGQPGPLPPGNTQGITYGANLGDSPILSVTTWTVAPPYPSGTATATSIRGHHGQLFSIRDGLGVRTYSLWWHERSHIIEVDAVGLPLSQLRRFAESLRPVDERQFRAAASGLATRKCCTIPAQVG
jgi:hypothetical protein